MGVNTVVVGSGVGGLAAAIELAAAGRKVTVLEQASEPGGKMRQLPIDSQGVDAGPTVFTMRWIFDALLAQAGTDLEAELTFAKAHVLARHAWTSGGKLDLYASTARSAEAIAEFAGRDDARAYLDFCRRSEEVYQTLRDPFIASARPGLLELVRRVGYDQLAALWRTAPFQSLWQVLGRQFSDPRLRQLFGRYATYVGSSPLRAPATLMLIAHVEQDGVWLVEGGMRAVASALASVAERLGATFHFQEGAAKIDAPGGRIAGVHSDKGRYFEADQVIFNGDASALGDGLLGADVRGAVKRVTEKHRALSAITQCVLGKVSGFDLHYHNVFFAEDYPEEFAAIFNRRSITRRPTVYVCAQDRSEGSSTLASQGSAPQSGIAPLGTPSRNDERERLLLLINAPADGDRIERSDEELESYRVSASSVLAACGCEIDITPGNSVTTDPRAFAERFPGSGGALYGRANHGPMASFARPGARTPIRGLYLAGGSVHPGAGVPMSAMSGRLAAAAALADR
ncbi:MAG: phytoene desaturase family protein [Pseudomonadota bacterium]